MTDIPKQTILIVDDDEATAQAIQTILVDGIKLHAEIVSTGVEALAHIGVPYHGSPVSAANTTVVLVILDVMLPDISGFQVCDYIKRSEFRNIPVILITGYDISEYVAQGVEVGADDFLSKPFVADELIARSRILIKRGEIQAGPTARPLDERAGSRATTSLADTEINHYAIINMLSWSASSMIYTVDDTRHGGRYVLKRLMKQVLEFPDVIHRFNREIQIMKRLRHPNICQIHDDGVIDDCPYCVMEYIEGDDLESILSKRRHIAFDTIRAVAVGLATALKAVHNAGVVHRDIKLNNIYLNDDGVLKLSDFGVAIQIGDTRLTQHGYAIGTPIYMSPEQFDGGGVKPSSDIYSYGATLYHLITGKPPFSAENVIQLMRKHHNEVPTSLHLLRSDIPDGWNELIVDRCLAKDPGDRPQSMTDVLYVLNAIGANERQTASTTTTSHVT